MIDDTLLVLRSQDAVPDSTGVYTYDLVAPILAKRGHYLALSVDSAAIPHSFYNVSSSNNTIQIEESGSNVRSIQIPIGNYTANTLKVTLMTGLNTGGTLTYTVSFDEITGKFTLASASSNFKIVGANTTMRALLGFGTADYTSSNSSLNSVNVADLVVHHHIGVESNLASFSILDSKQKMQSTSLLALIPINAPLYDMIYHSAGDSHMRNVLTAQMVTTITIKMIGAKNIALDFNNVPWEITLRLEQLPAGPSPMLATPEEQTVALLRELVHIMKDQNKPTIKSPAPPPAAIVQHAIEAVNDQLNQPTLLGNI